MRKWGGKGERSEGTTSGVLIYVLEATRRCSDGQLTTESQLSHAHWTMQAKPAAIFMLPAGISNLCH